MPKRATTGKRGSVLEGKKICQNLQFTRQQIFKCKLI